MPSISPKTTQKTTTLILYPPITINEQRAKQRLKTRYNGLFLTSSLYLTPQEKKTHTTILTDEKERKDEKKNSPKSQLIRHPIRHLKEPIMPMKKASIFLPENIYT